MKARLVWILNGQKEVGTNSHHFVKKHEIRTKTSGFQMVETIAISNLQKVRISNGWVSDPHCTPD